jgi:hypothetical protein
MRGAVWGVAGLMIVIHENEFVAHLGIDEADPSRKAGL